MNFITSDSGITTVPDYLSVLRGRAKGLDPTRFGYKFNENSYGLDVSISEDMDIDENRMAVVIPFADGRRRDGVGDLLEVGGIRTERHKANPLVLYDHGKSISLPIALAEDPETKAYTVQIDTVNQCAKALAFFYRGTGMNGVERGREKDHALFCEQLFDLIAKRYIRAGSIGYQVIKAMPLQPDYERGTPQGLHLLSVLMLECSAVVLPANQDTTRKMLSLPQVCGKPLSPILVKSLSAYAPEETKTIVGFSVKSNPTLESFARSAMAAGISREDLIGEGAVKTHKRYYPPDFEAKIPGLVNAGYLTIEVNRNPDDYALKTHLNYEGGTILEMRLTQKGVRELGGKSLKSLRQKYRKKDAPELSMNQPTSKPGLDSRGGQRAIGNVPADGEPNLEGELPERELQATGRKGLPGIFTGAVWDNDRTGDTMKLEMRGTHVYGAGDKFDFERNSAKEAKEQLEKWGYRWVGGESLYKSTGQKSVQFYTAFDANGKPIRDFNSAFLAQTDKFSPQDKERMLALPYNGETEAEFAGQRVRVMRWKRMEFDAFPSRPDARRFADELQRSGHKIYRFVQDQTGKWLVYWETEGGQEAIKAFRKKWGKTMKATVKGGPGSGPQPHDRSRRHTEEYQKEEGRRSQLAGLKKPLREKVRESGRISDVKSIRMKYRQAKNYRRKLRKSSPGSSVLHVSEKDLGAVQKFAEDRGMGFKRIGSGGIGLERVKLIGDDGSIDEAAKRYGKALPNSGQKQIDPAWLNPVMGFLYGVGLTSLGMSMGYGGMKLGEFLYNLWKRGLSPKEASEEVKDEMGKSLHKTFESHAKQLSNLQERIICLKKSLNGSIK